MFMLREQFGPTVKASLTPGNTKEMIKSIGQYIDRNSEILMSMNLSARYSFSDNDRAVIYSAINVSEPALIAAIKDSKTIYKGNKIQSTPFYHACMLCSRDLLIKKDEKSAMAVLTYMSLMMYTSIHKGFFEYGANQQIMDYTIANLDNSFLIRQFPSLFAYLQDNASTALTAYKSRIIKGDDGDFTYVIDAYWTRIKQKLRKISREYYNNHKAGNYLNQDTDSYSEDDYHEMDNVSYAADRLTNAVYLKLINRQYDRRYIKYSISTADTSYQRLLNLIEDIIDADDGTLKKVISNMITHYIQNSGKPISYVGKGDYIVFMKTQFSSNTDIAEIRFIKDSIDKWLADNMMKYGKAVYGKTIKLAYRKSIYMFLVFMINAEAKMQ